MSINPPKYTYDDYKLWQGDWELIDGYPFAMAPSPYGKHQKIMSRLIHVFSQELEDCDCDVYPELDLIIDEKNVVRPDLALYCEEVEKYSKTMPKLVVEIISKSSSEKDEDIKFKLYEKEGILYYIIVYPDFEKVRVFKLVDEIYKKVYEGDGKFDFKFDECEIEIDFFKIFK